MKKNKQMSKNELCSYIHALTGKSYKDARAICKAAKWNPKTAFCIATLGNEGFVKICETITETRNAIVNSLTPAIETAVRYVKDFADVLAQAFYNLPSLEPWTAETSADILNGNEIKQIFDDEINEGGADNAGI